MTLRSLRGAVVGSMVLLAGACDAGKDMLVPPPTNTTTTTTPPVAAPTPQGFVCPLPPLPDLHNKCPQITPELNGYVNNAVDTVIAQHPELFDFNNNLGPLSPRVLDRKKYIDAVVAAIQAQGPCAKDDNEEVAIKIVNSFNEQYNVYTSGGYVRRSYITTCFPAQF